MQNDFDQRGFAAAVGANDHNTFAALDQKGNVIEQFSFAKRHRKSSCFEYVVARGACLIKAHTNGTGIILRTFDTFHFVKQLLAAFGGNDVALAVPSALLCDIGFLPCNFFLLILPMLFGNFAIKAALLHTLGIVAAVKLCAVMLNGECFVCYLIQKVTVVRDDHDAFGIGAKKTF